LTAPDVRQSSPSLTLKRPPKSEGPETTPGVPLLGFYSGVEIAAFSWQEQGLTDRRSGCLCGKPVRMSTHRITEEQTGTLLEQSLARIEDERDTTVRIAGTDRKEKPL